MLVFSLTEPPPPPFFSWSKPAFARNMGRDCGFLPKAQDWPSVVRFCCSACHIASGSRIWVCGALIASLAHGPARSWKNGGGKDQKNWDLLRKQENRDRGEYDGLLDALDEFMLPCEQGQVQHIQLMTVLLPSFQKEEMNLQVQDARRLALMQTLVQSFDFRFLKNFLLFSFSPPQREKEKGKEGEEEKEEKKEKPEIPKPTAILEISEINSLRHLASAREFSPYSPSKLEEHFCPNVTSEERDEDAEDYCECSSCVGLELLTQLPPSCLLISGWTREKAFKRLVMVRQRGFRILHPVPGPIEEAQLRQDTLEERWTYTGDLSSYAWERFQRTRAFDWEFYLKR